MTSNSLKMAPNVVIGKEFLIQVPIQVSNFVLQSNSCDAIAEEDEEIELELGTKGSGDTPAVSEERNAAALRIIRRAKRAGMARDRAYSTSEGIYNLFT